MKGRIPRVGLLLVLLVAVPLATIAHTDHVSSAPDGLRLGAHHHGPHSPCPSAEEHSCLACQTASLFAPAPDVLRLAPPSGRRAECRRVELADSFALCPAPLGRSPPTSSAA